MLVGVVVGARFEGGTNPKFHIDLRQDANPNNIIPLTYEAKNAAAMVSKVKYGSLIYVDGEYGFRQVPINKMGEDGKALLDENFNPIPELDEQGAVKKRIHTFIRITAPKAPAEFDTDFSNGVPKWVTGIAEEIAQARARHVAAKTGTPTSEESESTASAVSIDGQ
jgi:hypothetical protein